MAVRSLMACALAGGAATINSERYLGLGTGAADIVAEGLVQFQIGVSATIDRLGANYGSSTSSSRIVGVRKNGAAGVEWTGISGTGAGCFVDDTGSAGSISVSSGDLIDFNVRATSGNSTWRNSTANIVASTGVVLLWSGDPGGVSQSAASTTRSLGIHGFSAIYSNGNVQARTKISVSGTLRVPHIYVTANLNSDAATFELYENGSATGFGLSVAAGATGLITSLLGASTYAVTAGNEYDWRVTKGAGGSTFTWTFIGATLETTSGAKSMAIARAGGGVSRTGSATVNYLPINTRFAQTVTDETTVVMKPGFVGRASQLRVLTATAGYDSTVTLRKNGVDTGLTVTQASGASGWAENNTDTVSFLPTDELSFSWSGGTSGSCQMNAVVMTLEDLSEAPGVGTATATSSASAVSGALKAGVGSASGSSNGAGVGAATFGAVGTAAATSAANGVGDFSAAVPVSGVGTAAATSDAQGIAGWNVYAVGSAAGRSSAVGVSGSPPPSAVGAKRLIAVEITAAIDAAGTEQTFYFADARFTTQPTDTPANVSFDENLSDPGSVTITVFGDGRTGGGTKLSLGEIKLKNPDGQYDGWLDYGFDGRRVVIRRGIPGAYPADFETVFTGTIRGRPTVNTNEVVLSLLDKQHIFDRPLLVNRYGGTNVLPNGIDGTADDLAGRAKPRLLGRVFNEAPPCVNTSKLVFQINDGPITSVEGVYDRGEPLVFGANRANRGALLSTAPAAGSYDTCLAEGLFRLGADPEGEITFGATQGAAATDRTAAQLLVTLALEAGVLAGEIADADATDLASDAPAVLGLWVNNDGDTFAKVMDRIAESVGGFYGFDPAGVLRMGRLVEPAGDPVLSLEEFDILSIERRPARDGDLPTWAYTVRHSRVGTVQTSDLAPAVDPARRAFLGAEYRAQRAEAASVKAKYLLAAEGSVDTALTEATDGANEASRRQALHGVARDFYDVTVKAEVLIGIVLRLTSIVEIIHRRFGLSDGRLFVLLGIRLELARNRVTLTLWG